jgi:hypothetical protein
MQLATMPQFEDALTRAFLQKAIDLASDAD